MNFQVPQFIDIEDKIFGPLTFRQFVYLAGGGGLVYLLLKSLPLAVAIVFIVPVAALSGALAFVKINNKPFVDMIEAAVTYFIRDKLYIWKKELQKKGDAKKIDAKEAAAYIPKITESKLHDISWGLDVLDSDRRQ